MDPEIIKLRNNLNTLTLEGLKKEVIKIKHLNFAVTRINRNQVIQLIINYRILFPYLMNKTGTKRRVKPKKINILPARIKLAPELLAKLAQANPTL